MYVPSMLRIEQRSYLPKVESVFQQAIKIEKVRSYGGCCFPLSAADTTETELCQPNSFNVAGGVSYIGPAT
jgi:hypothetical protein